MHRKTDFSVVCEMSHNYTRKKPIRYSSIIHLLLCVDIYKTTQKECESLESNTNFRLIQIFCL